ncbi:hypothetical protein [Roseimaritima ulvae]|uniref:Uncharacterized protein n=1 Tax=Roseimaritima ulvae TaxID=980254 RepID=A0A5B9QXW2_9BACT|nr:hypothetical protein [Roseimaritima ulvae]QEG42719.1 hypothetical protein UC8_47610 [Roseimaritima ulvae]
MTTFIVIVFGLLMVMVVGHVLWLIMAALFRAITGTTSNELAGNRRQPASDPSLRRDLWGYKNTVDRLGQQGRIDVAEREHLHALGRVLGEQLFAATPATAQPPVAQSAVEPLDGERAEQYQGGVHPLDQVEETPPLVAALADTGAAADTTPMPSAATPAAGQPPLAGPPNAPPASVAAAPPIGRRAMSEVLSSFLVAHNIRWGELIAGLLIVFCSVGLVISLWHPLTETHRLLPSLVFLGGTIAIEAAGLYTLRRWRLRHTSRAVLTIATLLIPLSVVAGIAVAGTGEDAVRLSDPAALGFITIGSVLYLGAIWLSGLALVRRHDALWWLLAIAVPTLSLPLVPAVVRQWGGEGGWLVAAAAWIVSAAVLVPAGRRRARAASHAVARSAAGLVSWPVVRPVAGRHQLMITAVGLYALAVLIGFFTFHYSATLSTVMPLAISMLPLLVTLGGVGAVLRDSRVSWQGLTGTVLVATSSIAVLAVFPIAANRPAWLLLWGLSVIAASGVVAWRLRSQAMLAWAGMALGVVAVMIIPWWLGPTPLDGSALTAAWSGWGQTPWGGLAEIWRRPFSGTAMLTAFIYGLGLLACSVALPQRMRLVSRADASSGLATSLVSATWLVYAVLLAVISGCFGWLFAPPTAWRTAAAVIACTGLLSIATAILIKRDRTRFAPLWHPLRFRLLWIGQCGLLLAAAIVLAWSVPLRVWGVDAWRDGNASWWWIGLVGGFAALWQIPRWLSPKSFPANLMARRNWLPLDVGCGLTAAVAVMLCGMLAILRLILTYGTDQPLQFASWNVPLVALALLAFWLVAYRERTSSLRAILMDVRVLTAHAALGWISIRILSSRPLSLQWIGSIELLATLAALLLAWRWARPRFELAKVLASRSAGWGGVVVAALSVTLLYHHLLQSFVSNAAIDPQAVWTVVIWIATAILALSIGSVVTAQRGYAVAAAALVPLAAGIAAAVYTQDRWIWLETIGWTSLSIVACQRLCEASGFLRRLRTTAVAPAIVSKVDTGEEQRQGWPLPVVGLTLLATAIACVFALVSLPLVWTAPLKAAALARPSAVGLIAAALLAGRFIPAARWSTWPGLNQAWGLSNLVAILAGPAIALAIRLNLMAPGDGRLWLLGSIALLAALDAVISALHQSNQVAWTTGMVKASAVVLLGYSSAVWGQPVVWISISGSVVIQVLSMVVTNQIADTASGGRAASATMRIRYWLGQGLWCFGTLLSIGLLLSAGWSTPLGGVFTTAMILSWLTATTVLARLGQRRLHPSYPCVGEWLSLVCGLLAMGLILSQRIELIESNASMAIVTASVVLSAILLVLTTALRMSRPMHVVAGLLAALMATGLLTLDIAERLQIPSTFAVVAVGIALMTTLATWLWPLRRVVRRTLVPYDLHWSRSEDQRCTAELTFVVLGVATVMLSTAVYGAIEISLPTTRYLLIAAVMLSGWATANVAGHRDSVGLRTIAVLVFAMAILLTTVATPQLGALRVLVTAMRMLVAGCCLVPIFGFLVPRTFGLDKLRWQRPLQVGVGVGLAVAGVALVTMFAAEVMARVNGHIESLDKPLVVGIAVLLAVMCAAATWLAVRPADGRRAGVLPRLPDRERAAMIYVAQLLGFLCWLHLFLCRSYWALLGLRPYWPYIVMALAFISVAVVEWARRRGDRVLADTLRQSSLLLPLVPAIGFWFSGAELGWAFIGGRVDYAVALAVGGFYYLALCFIWRSNRWPRVLGVVLGNAALWVVLVQQPSWEFLKHPQLWLIPPAVCVLLAAHLDRQRLQPQVLAAVRYAAMLVIYVSSTADMFIQQIGETLWGPMILLTLALAGVAVGMLLRVRSFLYVGTLFVLVGVLSMVWHAQAAMDEVWPWWAFGISSGLLILVGLTMIEKKKPQIRRLSQQLAGWNG